MIIMMLVRHRLADPAGMRGAQDPTSSESRSRAVVEPWDWNGATEDGVAFRTIHMKLDRYWLNSVSLLPPSPKTAADDSQNHPNGEEDDKKPATDKNAGCGGQNDYDPPENVPFWHE